MDLPKAKNIVVRKNREGWIQYVYNYGAHKYRVLVKPSAAPTANVRVTRLRDTSNYMLATVTWKKSADLVESITRATLDELARAFMTQLQAKKTQQGIPLDKGVTFKDSEDLTDKLQ